MQALRHLCRHFFLTYSLVYITQPVFLPFLKASSAQNGRKQKFTNQNTGLGTLSNGFAEL